MRDEILKRTSTLARQEPATHLRLVRAFVDDLAIRLAALRSDGSMKAWRETAHMARGTAGMLGAEALAQIAGEVHDGLGRADPPDHDADNKRMTIALDALRTCLEEEGV